MSEMNITQAKYCRLFGDTENSIIKAVIDGEESCVPIKVGNRHYDEIQRQVEAGTLTIQDAD